MVGMWVWECGGWVVCGGVVGVGMWGKGSLWWGCGDMGEGRSGGRGEIVCMKEYGRAVGKK